MHKSPTEETSLLGRVQAFVARYRLQLLGTLAVLATLSIIAEQVIPGFQSWLIKIGVIQYVTLLIVLDIAASEHSARREQQSRALRAQPNQDVALPLLIEHVEQCRPTSADLLEYACATTLPLVRAIRREHVPMRLLVKHPDTLSGLQQQRAITALDTLYNSIFDEYSGFFDIRCYRQPYSLRARRFGNSLLELGWLTPDWRRETAYGHGNPSIIVDLKREENEAPAQFFERTFSALWDAPDTEDGHAVLEKTRRELDGTVSPGQGANGM